MIWNHMKTHITHGFESTTLGSVDWLPKKKRAIDPSNRNELKKTL